MANTGISDMAEFAKEILRNFYVNGIIASPTDQGVIPANASS
ncbi:MAG: hypothetical protein WAT09_11105 [Paracoccaceae bacterium]